MTPEDLEELQKQMAGLGAKIEGLDTVRRTQGDTIDLRVESLETMVVAVNRTYGPAVTALIDLTLQHAQRVQDLEERLDLVDGD